MKDRINLVNKKRCQLDWTENSTRIEIENVFDKNTIFKRHKYMKLFSERKENRSIMIIWG